VDWPGKIISVVEVSENEDMSNSRYYGSEEETENHNFTVTVEDLKEVTKYYYRFWSGTEIMWTISLRWRKRTLSQIGFQRG